MVSGFARDRVGAAFAAGLEAVGLAAAGLGARGLDSGGLAAAPVATLAARLAASFAEVPGAPPAACFAGLVADSATDLELALVAARAGVVVEVPASPLAEARTGVLAEARAGVLGTAVAAAIPEAPAGGLDAATAPAAGGSLKLNAMSSANGRPCGIAAINPAICRQASTRSAICPGFNTNPDREIRICISAGLIVGTGLAGSAAMRGDSIHL